MRKSLFSNVSKSLIDCFMQACGKTGQNLAGREVFVDLARERVWENDFKSPRGGGARLLLYLYIYYLLTKSKLIQRK